MLWLRDIIIESEYDPMVNHAKAIIEVNPFRLPRAPGPCLTPVSFADALLSDWHGRLPGSTIREQVEQHANVQVASCSAVY